MVEKKNKQNNLTKSYRKIEKKSIRCTAAQKITTYYNIYKTNSSHSIEGYSKF